MHSFSIYALLSFSVSCGQLTVTNGYVTHTYPTAGIATYTCNSGYSLVDGDQQRACQSDGIWGGTAPSCIGTYDICLELLPGRMLDFELINGLPSLMGEA